ncbi:hypothetical protein EJ04DRAFT_603796, partial [Polyplosphaeria fusca]
MADPLSVAAGVAGLLSLTIQLCDKLTEYTSSVKNAAEESSDLNVRLRALANVLDRLGRFLREQKDTAAFEPTSVLYQTTQQCHEKLKSLETVVSSFMKETQVKNHVWKRCVMWPLKKREHEQTVFAIQHWMDIFNLSLSMDTCDLLSISIDQIKQLRNSQSHTADNIDRVLSLVDNIKVKLDETHLSTNGSIDRLQSTLEDTQARQMRKNILEWVSNSVDPSTNYNDALGNRHPGTGRWFLESTIFKEWVMDPHLLWLHGIPGCGKTFICATIIEAMKELCGKSSQTCVVYFHFDFQDGKKQDARIMMRSMLRQLCAALPDVPKAVASVFKRYEASGQQPPLHEIASTLQEVIQGYQGEIYFILDALDEVPDQGPRNARAEVLDRLVTLAKAKIPHLHILATSRSEFDIRQALESISCRSLCLENSKVDPDIQSLVQSRLTHGKLSSYSDDVKADIENVVGHGAHGMFRWAALQLNVLEAKRLPKDIRDALRRLPKTLNATYERMLAELAEDDKNFAMAMFRWLLCGKRFLDMQELAEAAVRGRRVEKPLNAEDRLTLATDIFSICRSFVKVSRQYCRARGEYIEAVQFAHFSVQEFLTSSESRPFQLVETHCHAFIGSCCVSHL